MSYDEWRFTFGAKTKAQIDAIPQTYMSLGNSVWNSNLMKPEYVNGYSISSTYIRKFVNEDCVMLINNTGATLSEGQVVRISNTGLTDGVSLATSSNDDYLCGVVYRGAANQDVVVVAIQGEYKVKIYAGEVTLPVAGKIVTVSTTPGEGDMTGATTGATNNIGVCVENLTAYPSDRLVKCMIQNFQSI